MYYLHSATLVGSAIEKVSEETSAPSRKHSCQAISNGVTTKSNNELLYSQSNDKTNASDKTSVKNNVKVSSSASWKKLNEDHNLNELENKNEQDSRLANGHAGRSLNKKSSPLRVNGNYHEDSDSGESSNTSTSSCSGSKKESQSKTTQVWYLLLLADLTVSKRPGTSDRIEIHFPVFKPLYLLFSCMKLVET